MAKAIRITLTPKVKSTIEVLERKYPTLTEVEIVKLSLSTLLTQITPTEFQNSILEAEMELNDKIKKGERIKVYNSANDLLKTIE